MRKKQTTIKDIANELNLHFTTVARALRNHPDVNSKTKELVLQTAKRLNYTPNHIASSLKSKKTKTIGVIVPDIRHDFFAAAISGIEKVAHQFGYIIMVCQSNESFEREKINVSALASNQVAGLAVSIAQDTKNGDHFQQLIDEGIPVVQRLSKNCPFCGASKSSHCTRAINGIQRCHGSQKPPCEF